MKKVMQIQSVVAEGPVIEAYYLDEKDASWSNSAVKAEDCVLSPAELKQLSPKESSVLEFGMRQARLLSSEWELPTVIVSVVSDLPVGHDKKAIGNAFRRSYRYDENKNQLFVRKERLEEPGAFLMVVLHAMAHIKVNAMEHDQAPEFVGAFYAGLKSVCIQLAKARSKVGDIPSVVSQLRSAAEGGSVSREDALESLVDLSV